MIDRLTICARLTHSGRIVGGIRSPDQTTPLYRKKENASGHHNRHRSAHATTTRNREYLDTNQTAAQAPARSSAAF